MPKSGRPRGMDSDSLYQDEDVLAVFEELVSANPFLDCVTGKRGHEHRGSDKRTKRRSGALKWSEAETAADAKTAAQAKAAAAAVAAAKTTGRRRRRQKRLLHGEGEVRRRQDVRARAGALILCKELHTLYFSKKIVCEARAVYTKAV